jgi:peptide/nickel transport system permease protein
MLKRVGKMIGSRLSQLLIMVFVLSFLTFLLMKITPGDPIRTILKVDDVSVTTDKEEELKKEYGFDKPILQQYGEWIINVAQFDLGESLISKKPVSELILDRLPATLPLGVISALYENRWPDYISRWFALVGASIPSFWLGLLLMYFFSLKLQWLPMMGRGTFAHFVLPSFTLGLAMAPIYITLLRERLITILQSPYIEAAKARGISKSRILFFHALRGSLIPLVTMFGLSLGSLLGGISVIEILYSWPGMGELIVQAVMQRDYPLIQGFIIVIGFLIVLTNLLIDLLYMVINPQVQQGEEARL